MNKTPIFIMDENKMILPWRDCFFSVKNIIVITGFFISVILLSGIIENIEPSKYYIAAIVFAFLMPIIFWYVRYYFTSEPFIVDDSGIIAPTYFKYLYITWSEVSRVEHIWGMIGSNISPIENNLIIHKKNGKSKRLFIPELTIEEKEAFFKIMQNLSKNHNFELAIN